ncbi:hypothetical protein [Paraliomyxa miuraensis]|uniref:hypothetical protein n=1 Tax=Paraliomyxa miuraensis TaxID=376150 RepID=UPI0022572882|nr:hypothetical protein [Paraliomyxa miuraensis]MCX4245578.1 hypothetical protein [Paraliomyxa miuraensis]
MQCLHSLRLWPWLLAVLLLPACDPAPGDTDADAATATDGATSMVSGTTTAGTEGSEDTLDPSATSTAGTAPEVCQPLPQDGWPCTEDGDCEIAGDCCGCTAYNPSMGAPGNCGGGCGQTVCEQLGVTEAYCDTGVCRVRGLSCDQTAVQCDAAAPACPDGQLPQVSDHCYTGACLPIEHCDWVPDCSYCAAGDTCVITQTAACDQHRCLPPFPECPGPATCNCLGAVACAPPHGACAIDGDAIVCS